MTAPTFLVIGAQKAGTTWLERNIGIHPEVSTPRVKELHFFDKAEVYARGREWYEDQFSDCPGIKAAGEFTPNYFWLPASDHEAAESGQLGNIPERVRSYYPDIRLILILRDPVERAISAYYHQIRARRVTPRQRISEVWDRFGIRSMGEYGHTLTAWRKLFPMEQFKILFHETAVKDSPVSAIHECYRFIGVNDMLTPDQVSRIHNPGDSHFLLHLHHRLPGLARLVRKVNPRFGNDWNRFSIPVSAAERVELRDYYREDTAVLEGLLESKTPWSC